MLGWPGWEWTQLESVRKKVSSSFLLSEVNFVKIDHGWLFPGDSLDTVARLAIGVFGQRI